MIHRTPAEWRMADAADIANRLALHAPSELAPSARADLAVRITLDACRQASWPEQPPKADLRREVLLNIFAVKSARTRHEGLPVDLLIEEAHGETFG